MEQCEIVRVLLISTYDLGRQPFGLASPAAWLRNAGVEVACVDTSRDALTDEHDSPRRTDRVLSADAHGDATGRPADRTRPARQSVARDLAAYGLYAPLNAALAAANKVSTRARARVRRQIC